jgi:hypothetical protein
VFTAELYARRQAGSPPMKRKQRCAAEAAAPASGGLDALYALGVQHEQAGRLGEAHRTNAGSRRISFSSRHGAARGWRVHVEVQAPLVRLLRTLPGIESVVARGKALPALDAHAPLLSLPRLLSTTLDTILGATP